MPLIDPPALAALLETGEPPTVLDVRWALGGPPGRDAYDQGHVPGAVYVDLETELAGPPGAGGRHPLPARGDLIAVLRAAGVWSARTVVVYDAASSTSAARAWWLLRYLGHSDVRVLDGGLAAWVAEGLAVSAEEPSVLPGDFAPSEPGVAVLDQSQVLAVARDGVLLDARAGERYRGDVEPVDPVAGHIPGALSAPTTENVDAAGRFLPVPLLRERFAALGAVPGRPMAAYCGSGVTAAHTVLALSLIGVDAALYAGSWSEWVHHPAGPVVTGEQP